MPKSHLKVVAKSEADCSPIDCRVCGVYNLCMPNGEDDLDFNLIERVVKNKTIYRRGDFLFRMGQPLQSVFALRCGSVKTYILSDDGRVQITGFHVAGELLGLNGMHTNRYNCEARALETTAVCELPLDVLEQLSGEIPELRQQLLRLMSREIAHNQELMLLLGKKNADERLATYLLGMSRRFEMRNYSPAEFNLSMSRGDIGNYLGMAEETVCRVLARFEQEGIISTRRRNIRLNDFERLRMVAHGIPRPEMRTAERAV